MMYRPKEHVQSNGKTGVLGKKPCSPEGNYTLESRQTSRLSFYDILGCQLRQRSSIGSDGVEVLGVGQIFRRLNLL